jgi:hypothetical protein
MQFTALNTVAFADIARPAMAAANTLFSAAFQLAMGLGVALAAIAWRLGALVISPTVAPAGQFRIAFLVIAAVSLIGLWDSLTLSARAGEDIT